MATEAQSCGPRHLLQLSDYFLRRVPSRGHSWIGWSHFSLRLLNLSSPILHGRASPLPLWLEGRSWKSRVGPVKTDTAVPSVPWYSSTLLRARLPSTCGWAAGEKAPGSLSTRHLIRLLRETGPEQPGSAFCPRWRKRMPCASGRALGRRTVGLGIRWGQEDAAQAGPHAGLRWLWVLPGVRQLQAAPPQAEVRK